MARTRAGSRRMAATPPHPTTIAMHCASTLQWRSGPTAPSGACAGEALGATTDDDSGAAAAFGGVVVDGSGAGAPVGVAAAGASLAGAAVAGATGGEWDAAGLEPHAARTNRMGRKRRTQTRGGVRPICDRRGGRLTVLAGVELVVVTIPQKNVPQLPTSLSFLPAARRHRRRRFGQLLPAACRPRDRAGAGVRLQSTCSVRSASSSASAGSPRNSPSFGPAMAPHSPWKKP